MEVFGFSLNSILFYSLVVLALATVISYILYRRSKQTGVEEKYNRRKNPTLDSFEHSTVDDIPRPIHEVEIPITKPISNPNSTEFDLKTELEKIFAKKVESGEIKLDLEPILDERVSKKDAFTIMGLSWAPKLKYINPTEKTEEEPISVPEEEIDVDAIPVGVVQEPELDRTVKKKKKTATEVVDIEGGS